MADADLFHRASRPRGPDPAAFPADNNSTEFFATLDDLQSAG
jgi:hypothetical protein